MAQAKPSRFMVSTRVSADRASLGVIFLFIVVRRRRKGGTKRPMNGWLSPGYRIADDRDNSARAWQGWRFRVWFCVEVEDIHCDMVINGKVHEPCAGLAMFQ